MDITPLAASKFAAGMIVGSGVSKIAKDIIVNNVNAPDTRYNKIVYAVGAGVIGMMAKDASKKYIHAEIDSLVETYKKFKEQSETETTDDSQEVKVAQ